MTDIDWIHFITFKVEEVDKDIEHEKKYNNDPMVLFGLRQKRSAFVECLQQAEKGVW